MQHDIDFTVQTITTYNNSANAFDLSPSEYLVWHALVYACSTEHGVIKQYFAASIADVSGAVKIQRETVKRSLLKLEANGLARRIQNRWIFASIDDE